MITVKMLDDHKIKPECMADYAARGCYRSEPPILKEEPVLDVEKQLFLSSHHTTMEHQLFNFEIDGISISDVTLGLHLLSPYYNTDQRSGRFSKMYENPDFEEIRQYIIQIYNEIENINEVMKFVEFGHYVFAKNIEKATKIAKNFLRKRVYENEEYIESNARKMAQEQLRNVVSTIFDSWCFFSIDIPSISALYEEPLTPGMAFVMDKIKEQFLSFYPEMSYVFRENKRNFNYQSIDIEDLSKWDIVNSPRSGLIEVTGDLENVILPSVEDMTPVDKLQYKKKYSENSLINICSWVNISIATTGQDQRHRSVKRSLPAFTSEFYASPIIQELGIGNDIDSLMNMWFNLRPKISNSLFDAIAPYGAVVFYEKNANINAFAHEQLKRLCFCTQEEIYNVNRCLRVDLNSKNENNQFDSIINMMLPPCARNGGRCLEGKRYCNRNPKERMIYPCPVREI